MTRRKVYKPKDWKKDILFRSNLFFERKKGDVTLIMLCKDGLAQLQECISSIKESVFYPTFSILVGDIGSTTEEIFSYYKELESDSCVDIRVVTNLSCNRSETYNYLVREHCTSDYFITIAPHVVAYNDFVSTMMLYAQNNIVGAVGAFLYKNDNTVWHIGQALFSEDGELLVPSQGPTHYNSGQSIEDIHLTDMLMDGVTGACQLIPKNIFMTLGGFDEAIQEAYYDVDFNMTLRQNNFKIVQCNSAQLLYCESETTSNASLARKDLFHYYFKWKECHPVAHKIGSDIYTTLLLNITTQKELPCYIDTLPKEYCNIVFSLISTEQVLSVFAQITPNASFIYKATLTSFLEKVEKGSAPSSPLMRVEKYRVDLQQEEVIHFMVEWHCCECGSKNTLKKRCTLMAPSLHICSHCGMVNLYKMRLVPAPVEKQLTSDIYSIVNSTVHPVEREIGRSWLFPVIATITNQKLEEE